MPGGAMAGHLFIVQGGLTRLACDAWLLPTGRSLYIRNQWLRTAPNELLRRATGSGTWFDDLSPNQPTWSLKGIVQTPPGWHDRTLRTFDVAEWETGDDRDRPW